MPVDERNPHASARRHALVPLSALILLASSAVAANSPAPFIGTNHSRGDSLLVLRMAISSTGEYTQEAGGTAAVQAKIDSILAHVNEVYGREYAVRFELIPNNSSLISTDPTSDLWPAPAAGGGCIGAAPILAVQAAVIDGLIGAANYDFSHVFADSSLAGGCAGGYKNGVSLPDNGIVRHEMGHQFQQSHTINDVSGARNADWAYELGNAGRSIQGGNSVANGHAASFHQLVEYILGVAAGIGTNVGTGNTIPIVDAGPDRVIPISTPFLLTGIAIDPDAGDNLTYTWDQLDRGVAQSPPLGNDAEGPLFSRLLPTTDDFRFFPQLSSILSNTYTGPLENLPTQPRDINLRLTVIDNHMFTYQGAQVPASGRNSDDVKITVVDNGGAFQVTNPNLVAAFDGGSVLNVTWSVAGTHLAPISTANVKISLSADGGQSFPIVLVNSTTNDGAEMITLPNINTTMARIKVEAVGNVYFDVSDQNFMINQNFAVPGIAVAITGATTLVSENGQTDTYTVSLLTAPTGSVTVTVSADSQTEVSLDGITFGSTVSVILADTAPRTITVRGKFDSVTEGPQLGSVTHFVSATGDAASYPVGMPGTSVLVNISDAQIPPVAGVDFDAPGSTTVPTHWRKLTMTVGQSELDLPLDDGTPTDWDLTTTATACGIGGCSFDFGNNSGSQNSPRHVQDLSTLGGVAVSQMGPVTATWSGLKAHTKYRVWVFAHYSLGGTVDQTVTITGDGTNDPPPFVQTVSGSLHVNDQVSSSQPLTNFAKEVTSTAGGTITITVANAGETWISGLAIQEVLGPPPTFCPAGDLDLASPQTTSSIYETGGKLTSTQAISGVGVVVEYYANVAVILDSGFQVGDGVTFTAGSRGCITP